MRDVATSDAALTDGPEATRDVLICGACRAVVQGTQVPDFCGRCQTTNAPFLVMSTVVEQGAGASMRVGLTHRFVGPWDAAKRAEWEARLGGGA